MREQVHGSDGFGCLAHPFGRYYNVNAVIHLAARGRSVCLKALADPTDVMSHILYLKIKNFFE